MPDLGTHLILPLAACRLAQVSGRFRKPKTPGWWTLLALGAVLPDLFSRALVIAFPTKFIYLLAGPAHTPVGSLVIALIIAFFFDQSIRTGCLIWLTVGLATHYFLDFLQAQTGPGGYIWFFPFSWRRGQAGLVYPDETILYLPYLLIAGLVIELIYRWRRRTNPKP